MKSNKLTDTLPCQHVLKASEVDAAKRLLKKMPLLAPQELANAGIDAADWPMLLRAAIESLRGTAAADGSAKRKFIETILNYGKAQGVFKDWSFIGDKSRQDYRVTLADGTDVGIEAKGCPDGNNSTIWDKPPWADEFIIWFLCPESLAHPPGKGLWSGIATRLMPTMVAEQRSVDAVMFFDGRCGSARRPCAKTYGVKGSLRKSATVIDGQTGKEDMLPPPCIYLMPKSYPSVPHNLKPPVHTLKQSHFSRAMLTLFNVPESEQSKFVHEASVVAEGTSDGISIQVSVTSRCWADGESRTYTGKKKTVKRG